jgi:hypothetical protein
MSRAIIKNAPPLYGNGSLQRGEAKLALLSETFLVHFQKFSPNLHIFMAKDYTHELLCEMTLEVKEILLPLSEDKEGEGHLATVVACSFPPISLEKLNEKIGFDGYLQELAMGQFQLKILEQLLLFCKQEDAVNLILTVNDMVNDADLDYLKFYRRFLISEAQVVTTRGEQTQIVIPADLATYDKVVDFMGKIDREFQCALWRGQSINPIFQDYLMSGACVPLHSEFPRYRTF